jgi:hypothetical protein
LYPASKKDVASQMTANVTIDASLYRFLGAMKIGRKINGRNDFQFSAFLEN